MTRCEQTRNKDCEIQKLLKNQPGSREMISHKLDTIIKENFFERSALSELKNKTEDLPGSREMISHMLGTS